MAPHSRTRGKHAFLPSGMSAFLKRRAGQLMGFLMFSLAVALAAALVTYHASDPSWNFAIEGPVKNILAFPGAVIADMMLQTFGVAGGLWVVVLLGWGFRSMASVPLRWALFRVTAVVFSTLLAASVAAQWAFPQTWLLPNSLGGALGATLLRQVYEIVGVSRVSFFGVGILFSFFSLLFLLLGLGISFRQLGKGFSGIGSFIKATLSLLYQGVMRLVFWTSRKMTRDINRAFLSKQKADPSFFEDRQDPSEDEDVNALAMKFSDSNEPFLQATPEDRAIYAPAIGGKDLSETFLLEEENAEEVPFPAPKREALKSSYSLSDSISCGAEDYELPSVDLLDASLRKTVQAVDPRLLEESAYHLKTVLEEFGVRGEIVMVRPGPVVTLYEFKPAAGIKTSRVIGLADDIARSMSALSARIAVIPGRNVIGIELPNPTRETVYLRELLQSDVYEKSTSNLALILGKDIGGQPVIADLTRMPHLLVAGTTGSGKSVAVNTMILSLLFRLPPDRCKFIMIDPKMLELSVYDGIPHLLSPVVTDPKKAIVALKWAVREMENRYRAMSKLGVRNIDGYNVRIREARQSGELLIRRVQTGFDPDSGKPIFENQPLDLESLPYIVIVVDEMADLMMVAGKEIEAAVQRLAQMARAAGIHLIMATQRPSVDVITGTIKANFPTRISFQVTSKIDSRTILGEQGAEQLLGQGDMLYMAGGGRITRVHGPFVRDDEVERIVAFLKTQAEPVYVNGVTDDEGEFLNFDEDGSKEGDSLYNQAVDLVRREGKASTSFIQRHLQIGYNKAAGIIEMMEKNGVVSPANHVGKREVLG
ncbi:MAG: cell division protein FtsK [Alphaproteobacteria bacterium]|jgi:S-DNA-T family DNA segregation ATPase FtsK/SpoIIIE|nr:cell division protein FtsK [Alphaproteobacteria bacterium]